VALELLPNVGASLPVTRKGQVKLSLRFGAPLDENINVLVLCQYASVIQIDEHKQVLFD